VEAEMAALQRGVAGQDARLEGPIRLTCTDHYIGKMLIEALSELCAQHAGIELELLADASYLDLSKREADIAVRALARGATPPEHLIGRRLVPITVCSYVASAHSHLDPERGPSRWLGSSLTRASEELVSASSHPEVPIWGSFSSMELMVEAARAGLGIVTLPTYVGDLAPGLERLAQADLRHLADFWLLSHRDLRENARLQAARERVARSLAEKAPLFRGETPGRCETALLRPEHAPGEPVTDS
jgi:DNA-binding transcriptional LysR family regulator